MTETLWIYAIHALAYGVRGRLAALWMNVTELSLVGTALRQIKAFGQLRELILR